MEFALFFKFRSAKRSFREASQAFAFYDKASLLQCRSRAFVAPQALSEGSGLRNSIPSAPADFTILHYFCRQSRRNKITKAGAFVKLRRRLRFMPKDSLLQRRSRALAAPKALSEGSGLRNSIPSAPADFTIF